MDFRNAVDEALVWARGWFDYGGAPWLYQIIIVELFLAAKLAARRIEPSLETRARRQQSWAKEYAVGAEGEADCIEPINSL